MILAKIYFRGTHLTGDFETASQSRFLADNSNARKSALQLKKMLQKSLGQSAAGPVIAGDCNLSTQPISLLFAAQENLRLEAVAIELSRLLVKLDLFCRMSKSNRLLEVCTFESSLKEACSLLPNIWGTSEQIPTSSRLGKLSILKGSKI